MQSELVYTPQSASMGQRWRWSMSFTFLQVNIGTNLSCSNHIDASAKRTHFLGRLRKFNIITGETYSHFVDNKCVSATGSDGTLPWVCDPVAAAQSTFPCLRNANGQQAGAANGQEANYTSPFIARGLELAILLTLYRLLMHHDQCWLGKVVPLFKEGTTGI